MAHKIDNIIIKCPECRQKLRVPLYRTKKLTINCQACKTEFVFDCRKFRNTQLTKKISIVLCCIFLLSLDVMTPRILRAKLNNYLEIIEENYFKELNNSNEMYSKKLDALTLEKEKEIEEIDVDKYRNKLSLNASKYYTKIWNERNEYDRRFAISLREKAQLEMRALSKDRTKTIDQIIKSIAMKASPPNSTIGVNQTIDGIELNIDFDMSELTSGESGSKTKHNTVDSLKKEVIKLISRVTNDVYQFTRDTNLSSIVIGCRHYVRNIEKGNYSGGSNFLGKSNTVLYKIRLNKDDLKSLKANPFLNIYSTTESFKEEQNEFPNLSISNEK